MKEPRRRITGVLMLGWFVWVLFRAANAAADAVARTTPPRYVRGRWRVPWIHRLGVGLSRACMFVAKAIADRLSACPICFHPVWCPWHTSKVVDMRDVARVVPLPARKAGRG